MGRHTGPSFGRGRRSRAGCIFSQRTPVKQHGKWTWNRIILYILSSLGTLAVICSPLTGSVKVVGWLFILVPLCLYLFLITACRDLVIRKSYGLGRRGRQNLFPYFPLLALIIILFVQFLLSFSIHIMDGQRAFLMGIVIFIILYALFWYFALKSEWTVGGFVLAAFALAIYCYSVSIHLNYIMVNKPAVHMAADVVEIKKENGFRGSYNYYIYVKNESGEPEKYEVSKDMYEYAGSGSTVLVCHQISVFGVRSRVLHKTYQMRP